MGECEMNEEEKDVLEMKEIDECDVETVVH